jgi:proteasome activator subunit 4
MFPHPLKPSRHSSSLAPLYLNIAESAQRFFHPGDVDEMLEAILPRATSSMDSIIATQTMLVHFLPISHCERWLPLSEFGPLTRISLPFQALMVVFRLWHGFNSGMWDDQASDLVGQLSIAHLDPARSDPSLINKIPRGIFNTPEEEAANPAHAKALRAHKARLFDVAGEIEEDDDGLNYWIKPEVLPPLSSQADPNWQGIRKDVGIFTDQEFEFIMSKCLRSLSTSLSSQESLADIRRTRGRSSSFFECHVPHPLGRSRQ